jgi:hypothetical protein
VINSIKTYLTGGSSVERPAPGTSTGEVGKGGAQALDGATKAPVPSVRQDPVQGKDASRSYGDSRLHEVAVKLESATPEHPVREGLVESFTKRPETVRRLVTEGPPGVEAVRKGVHAASEIGEFVMQDGQKDVGVGDATKVGGAEVRQRLAEMDLVEAAKTTAKAAKAVATHTGEGLAEVREASDKWIAAEKAKIGTMVATGATVGVGLGLLRGRQPPGGARAAVTVNKTAWTGTTVFGVGYELQDLHGKIHKGSAGVKEGMRIIEESNASRRQAEPRSTGGTAEPPGFRDFTD